MSGLLRKTGTHTLGKKKKGKKIVGAYIQLKKGEPDC